MFKRDQQLNEIIQKVLPKHAQTKSKSHGLSFTNQSVTQKYLKGSHKDPRHYNYELQLANSELNKQYSELARILNRKHREHKNQSQLALQIEETKSRLSKILNQNQTLQLSLSKIRASRSRNPERKSDEGNGDCCCTHRRKYQQYISKSGTANEQTYFDDSGIKDQQYIKIAEFDGEIQPEVEEFGVHCDLQYLVQEQSNVLSKREYREKLKVIILKQVEMIDNYQKLTKRNGVVGTIASCSTLKKLHGCPSMGSIIKTKRCR